MRPCTVCAHKDLGEIEALWRAGVTYKALSEHYHLPHSALHRHFQAHLEREPPKPAEPTKRPEAPPEGPDEFTRQQYLEDVKRLLSFDEEPLRYPTPVQPRWYRPQRRGY